MDDWIKMMMQNPWWTDVDNINKDEKIIAQNSSLKYTPRLVREIEYNFPDDRAVIYTLRGPRQVGKTTLLKLQIKNFLEGGVHPLRLLYYALDMVDRPESIVDIITLYADRTKSRRGTGRCYLFLDEITSVPDWQKGIKWLVDTGNLKNCTLLATGSHIVDLKSSIERLPGRRGNVSGGHDKILLPMKFSEYVSVLNPKIGNALNEFVPKFIDRKKILQNLANHTIDEKIFKIDMYGRELNILLDEYMVTGGLPRVVGRYATNRNLQDPDYETYVDVLLGEWNRLGKDATLLGHFGRGLLTSLGTPVSWNGLANKTPLNSKNTAQAYADLLEQLFFASVIFKYDVSSGAPLLVKNKKIYFTDPFFLHMIQRWTRPRSTHKSGTGYLVSDNNRGVMLEGIVANHLIRLAFSLTVLKSTFNHHNHVFYWRDKKNREVDFILYDGDKMKLPIEVKSSDYVSAHDTSGMSQFTTATSTSGILLSRNKLEERRNYVIIPASVFLTLI